MDLIRSLVEAIVLAPDASKLKVEIKSELGQILALMDTASHKSQRYGRWGFEA